MFFPYYYENCFNRLVEKSYRKLSEKGFLKKTIEPKNKRLVFRLSRFDLFSDVGPVEWGKRKTVMALPKKTEEALLS